MKVKLGDLIEEYSERNIDNKYKPVAVGKYGIRARESIYSKELAKDYSKNKLIYKGTLTIGMGSNQIDIGILRDDEIYSVSPAYHTYNIKISNYDYLDYLLTANNNRMFSIYANRGSRQGKTLDLKRWLTDELRLHDEKDQKIIVQTLNAVKQLISQKEAELVKLDNLIKARFIEMFENDNMNEKTIEDVASFCSRGKSPKYVTESKLKVINQACIYWDRFKFENVKYNEEDYDGDRIISNNDLLICSTGTGTLGRCNIFRAPDDSRYMADSHVTIIRLNGHILPEVFKAWFERPRTQEKLYSDCVSGSTNQIELSKEKLKNMNILVPPINLQKQFASFAKQVDKSKFVLSNELTMCDFYIRLIHDRVMHSRINLRVAQ